MEFLQGKFLLTINPDDENPVFLQVTQERENLYRIAVNIDHLSTPFFDDISTVIEGVLEVIKEEKSPVSVPQKPTLVAEERGAMPASVRALSGKVWSKYTLINHKPVGESFGQFEIKGDTLYLNSLSVGNILCKGTIGMTAPYPVDILIQLSALDMNDFLTLFVGKHEIEADAVVTGEIHISGKWDQVQLKAKLASYHGLVHKLAYNNIVLNAEGIYPIIHITDSNITKADGVTFNIAGDIDLSDRGNFRKQITSLSRKPLVSSEGGDLEWTLKRLRAENTSGIMEFKYLLRKENEINHLSEGGSGMLGIEQRMEF